MAITYTSSDESIVKVERNLLQLVGGGTAVVSASLNNNPVWQAASMDKNVTIVKINQVIVNASNGATIPNFTKDLGDFEFDPEEGRQARYHYAEWPGRALHDLQRQYRSLDGGRNQDRAGRKGNRDHYGDPSRQCRLQCGSQQDFHGCGD